MKKFLNAKFTLFLLLAFMLIFNVNISNVNANSLDDQISRVKVFDKASNIWKSKYFRIPSLQILSDGTMLAFSDIRYNGASDHGYIDIGVAKSTDGGQTWDYQIAMKNDRKNSTYSRVMDSTTVVTNTGRIILINGAWNTNGNWASASTNLRSDWSVQMVYSDNNGRTWSDKIDLTTNKARIKNQPSNTIGWLGGVGTGIVMEDNTIVIPAQIALRENNSNKYYSTIIYSKDNGETWTMGNKVPQATTSENMVIELDGALIMSTRHDYTGYRSAYISHDLGNTWEVYQPLHRKIKTGSGAGCQGSFIKVTASNGDRIGLISAPKNLKGGYIRDNITVYMINFDDLSKGITELTVPYPQNGNSAGGGYSSLYFNNGTLGILYEADGNIEYKDLTPYYLSFYNDKTANNNITYLSDTKWESQKASYGTIRRDISHDGVNKLALRDANGSTINYTKGVGAHSISEITVDLTDKDYDKFETSVGVLQKANTTNNNASVKFEFYLDDVLVTSTDIMNYATPKKDISINVANKSKLKIVISDAGNGIAGDWGVLADAKFISNSFEYLSEIDWTSQKASYGTIRRDISHDGVNKLALRDANGSTINYTKGVGAHSISEITVDLTDKDYDKFETSVGVLQKANTTNNNASVKFEFYLDDVLVTSTDIMNYATPKKDISINVANKSKLKIVISDAGNGIAGDWGVLADAKFTFSK
ncbi:NPCBM/NEW2 domain-containing protein [Clostridium sp.]|uniref:NPCBM/NEW2 domain-containing protein n=1 Tax=Clostridium sp. TaxID=1506 RepID=UPI0025BC8E16|nr:NPCBM/NEW2 domain-containing protein [Clostridium sp.]